MTDGAPSGQVRVQRRQGEDEDTTRVNLSAGERLASATGGGLLALWGLRRGSVALVLSGGALIYRGISGHCAVYERFGIDTTPADDTAAANGIR